MAARNPNAVTVEAYDQIKHGYCDDCNYVVIAYPEGTDLGERVAESMQKHHNGEDFARHSTDPSTGTVKWFITHA